MTKEFQSLDAYSCYEMRELRLINFHNFTDETIDIKGSLFLIGNNGTGKTTIIDALHLILTGGQQLTYNAATIFGPRSEAGRTLAGVILRHDFESGKIVREDGAVGYTALELWHPKMKRVVTIGIGAFVQSLDQRPEIWGFIIDKPLKDIPLTIRANPEEDAEPLYRPVDKRELIELIGKPHVYDTGRYRTQIANRLFGGRENFERVADLLKASKSYKELVVKARNFEGLFAFLLPAPDHKVFQDIESTLHNLDKIEADLKALKQEKDLLEEALQVVQRIAEAREAIRRYKYIQARSAYENIDKEATRIQRAIHRYEQAIADSKNQLETIVPQLEQTRSVLAELQIGEPGRLLEEMKRLEQERNRVTKELNAREAENEAESTKYNNIKRETNSARNDLSDLLREQLRTLDRISVPQVSSDLDVKAFDGALSTLKEAYRQVQSNQELETTELQRLLNRLLAQIDLAADKVNNKKQPLLLRKNELKREREEVEMKTIGAGRSVELLPRVPSYANFAAELESKNISWSPLYRLIDFKKKTPPSLMDVIEAWLGEGFLGTVFVEKDRLDEVIELACAKYPNIIIADIAALNKAKPKTASADSVASMLDAGKDKLVRKFLDINLSNIKIKDTDKKIKTGDWIALDGIAYHNMAYRRVAQPARGLLGVVRRQKALEASQNERGAKFAEIDSRAKDVFEQLESFENILKQFKTIRDDIEQRISPWRVAHRFQRYETLTAQLEDVKERISKLKTVARRSQKRIDQLSEQINAIKENENAQTTGDLTKQINNSRKQVITLERERDRCNEIIARNNERLDITKQQAEDIDSHRNELKEQLEQQHDLLKEIVSIEHKQDIEHYIDIVCEGRSIRTSKLNEYIREQERAVNREIGSLVGLEGDLNKGRGGLLHHELLWSKYAFVYNEVANELRDQNDKEAVELYDQLLIQVENIEGVVSERRRKLLEKTILGDLSNQYTRDLYRLRESLASVNLMLEGLSFGRTQYKFTQKIKSEYRQVYGIVRRAGEINFESQKKLKDFFESRLDQLRIQPDGTLPKFLDYRHWFDYQLHVKTVGSKDGIELTNDIRRLGSGGEQAVPNYLLIMAMSALLFNQIGSRVRVLIFDEAFYGIDAARRDELLRFAARLGIYLVIATPEMDGVTEAMRESTTLLLEKNEKNEVFVGNFVWESDEGVQLDIFGKNKEEEKYEISLGENR